jgi:hypothetical protein
MVMKFVEMISLNNNEVDDIIQTWMSVYDVDETLLALKKTYETLYIVEDNEYSLFAYSKEKNKRIQFKVYN